MLKAWPFALLTASDPLPRKRSACSEFCNINNDLKRQSCKLYDALMERG